LLQGWWRSQRKPRLRLLGASLSGFEGRGQQDLFEAGTSTPASDDVQDRINSRFGSGSLVRAGVLRTRERD
jgi:DNA polymerase-4